jgi:maltose O-acetyltransferase
VIGAQQSIEIADDVICGGNCLITDFDWHAVEPKRRHAGRSESAPVCLEQNVWLGVNAIVLKGVRIGQNSVIAANSVVVNDIPSNVIAGGNPCRVIRDL